MRNCITVFFLISTIISYPQKYKLICNDSIEYESINNEFIFKIKNKEIKLLIPDYDLYKNCEVSISCLNNDLILTFSFHYLYQYQIFHYLFEKKEDNHFIKCVYKESSDRNEYILSGYLYKDVSINHFDFFSNNIDNLNLKGVDINYITGYLDLKQISHIPSFYRLVKKCFNEHELKNIKLLTNPFVINKLNIIENESIKNIIDIAYYSFKSKGYNEALYILKKVIKKSPDRTIAHLNIADCFWQLNQQEEAKLSYQTYLSLMKSQKKDLKKVPKRVYERIQ